MLSRPARISYWFILITILLVGWLHLAMPLLSTLFAYFVLDKLHHVTKRKWVSISVFTVVILGIAYALTQFVRLTLTALPGIAETTLPGVVDWAYSRQIELPFTDYQSLKARVMETVQEAKYVSNFANYAKIVTTQAVFLVIGCVVAVSLFLNAQVVLDRALHPKDNLYALCADEIAQRFRSLYRCFVTVMGAQIIISAINTALTSIFVFAVELPHPIVIIGVTFFCGLLPVIGNLISNTVIVGISFTISPKMAFGALSFLVVIHKLEYFLNSKIIGDRIKNPVWLTLLGLILGEKLMGIPGLILAPVILNYLKVEASKIEVSPTGMVARESAGNAPPNSDSSPPKQG